MGLFLYSTEIKGDATEADHVGEIELTSVKFAQDEPPVTGGTSGRGGQLTLRDMRATKKQDSATTGLWKAAGSGQIFGWMMLDIVHNEKTTRYTMEKVIVGSITAGGDGFESFELSFGTLNIQRF